eukprot:COSAG05_NODE_12061_length_485_cov_0.699482_1_plen_93_part_10
MYTVVGCSCVGADSVGGDCLAERALLEISLAEQIESLVVQELDLRGEGTRTSTQLQLQLVAKKNEIFARAEEAGIEPERIANGVTYGADQSPR